jgi:hypothetical protein
MPPDDRPERLAQQTGIPASPASPAADPATGARNGHPATPGNGHGATAPARPSPGSSDTSGPGTSSTGRPSWRAALTGSPAKLAFASFLMLFVELALIRWTAANNVYVTNATNFVLLASFLGIGVGFLNARSSRDFVRWAPLVLLALVAFVLCFPVILASLSGPHPYQGLFGKPALPRPVSLAVVFVLCTVVMAGFGQAVARLFVNYRPLSAYRLDIAGSIAGIVVFSALSFLDAPPVFWGVVAAGGLVVLLGGKSARWWQWGAAAVVVVLLGIESAAPHQVWSPYYKLSSVVAGKDSALYVTANNIPYQAARSLPVLRNEKKFYFYPYQHVARSSLRNVLIVGAGTGNDVAVALAEGAKHVDAVEIDPVLLGIGKAKHPDHPYDSPRVTTYTDDGRAFVQDTTKKYNLILFALPDSLTAVAGQSSIRLESYLLTEQSVQAAAKRLAPGGTMAMYNYYAPFLLDRYATTMQDVFHRAPCAQVGPPLGGRRLAVLTDRPDAPVANCSTVWHGTKIAPATDDHPFPYLHGNTIPSSYLWMLGLILAASLLFVRVGGGRLRRMSGYLDLFFMGAAFMLLETKNIVQFALLFGTTWFVNALVTGAILVAVYLAVETARHVKLPPPWVLYLALIASLVVTWLVPQQDLVTLPIVVRFVAGAALAFAPVYLANLIFAQRFSDVETTAIAFAANLLGAMVGGVLEYLALITGYRFLLIVVGALYALAFLVRLRRGSATLQPA